MAQSGSAASTTLDPIMVGSEDLPLHCPTNSTPVWDMHPRVFLDIVDTGSAQCPYCGAKYQLKPGVSAGHGH